LFPFHLDNAVVSPKSLGTLFWHLSPPFGILKSWVLNIQSFIINFSLGY
jgi:hypothetical protein